MDKIDLDAIIRKIDPIGSLWLNTRDWHKVKELMKETGKQAFVLASEKAEVNGTYKSEEGHLEGGGVNKQSILDMEKLIV